MIDYSKTTDNERLKIFRKSTNMTQAAFSNALGMSQGAYSEVERGLKSISYNLLGKLVEIFGISATWLVTGNGDIWDPKIHTGDVKLNAKLNEKKSGWRC